MTVLDTFTGSLAAPSGRAGLDRIEVSMSRFHTLLTGYWLMFWLMNGLDKFFNESNFFGVTRDTKFADYFASIGLSEEIAMLALYGIGVYEVALGALFLVAFLHRARISVLNFVGLELSLALFAFFSLGDILFGDRRELWEHGCYIGLIIVSYLMAQRCLSVLERVHGTED
jgi:hypothetical protein